MFIECVQNMAITNDDVGFEGIVVLDEFCNKKYEKRWRQDYPRDIYSNTKSFTGAAVGMAIYEGLLSLDTLVIDIFKKKNANGFWKKLKLRDLLTMRSGFSQAYLMYFDRRRGYGSDNYVEYLINQPLEYEPGTRYLYSSGDAILAGCMVEKVAGMSLHSYVYKKLLLPLKIDYPIWESDLLGHTCGGSGLHLKLEDMAKLGCLYLNKGELNGYRFFKEDWVDLSFNKYVTLDNGGYEEGYGYYWRICNEGRFYKASGVFGQDTLVFPKEKMVLAYQCREGTDTSKLNKIIRKELVDKLK